MYKIGDVFKVYSKACNFTSHYMLSQVAPSQICLICINSEMSTIGNRFNESVPVNNIYNITYDEWELIIKDKYKTEYTFTKVNGPIHIS